MRVDDSSEGMSIILQMKTMEKKQFVSYKFH